MPTAHGHGAGSPNHDSDGGALRRLDRLHQTLHSCSSHLFNLERRARFEQDLVSTIELVVKEFQREAGQDVSVITSQIEMQKRLLASQAYDREMLPKRIQDQRSQTFSLVAQYNQQVNIEISHANMEIAESSRRIAEATMSDSASMKTIAILTMIFLPGTAIASFFSMTMFNWNAGFGSGHRHAIPLDLLCRRCTCHCNCTRHLVGLHSATKTKIARERCEPKNCVKPSWKRQRVKAFRVTTQVLLAG